MKLSDLDIQNFLNDYYVNKLTVKICCKKYNIGKSTALKILKEFGNGGRKRDEYNNNKYSCNESFFEMIDSHEKAYWFGFICADGNIYNQKLQIGLHQKDESHLLKFCKRINYNGPIYNDGTSKKLIVCRKQLVQDLKNLGLQENKTLLINQEIFHQIPNKYVRSAILGYIDGDGSFSKKGSGINFSLLGNYLFLNFVVSFLKERGISLTEPKKDKRTKQTYYINKYLSKENRCKMAEILYSNGSSDFLERKRNKLIYEK
jgi:hypothetical protein